MSSPDSGARGRIDRERQARQQAKPAINRDRREILVGWSLAGEPKGDSLVSFLEERGVYGMVDEEPRWHLIKLRQDENLGRVEELIGQWLDCADLPQPQGGG
jgi:hypothetical protein